MRGTVHVERDVPMPMRDGTMLLADVWRPAGSGAWPTLLQRLPYDKSSSFMAQHIVGLEPVQAVESGFAVVVQDTRGRYSSGGSFNPFFDETEDGLDTIAWIRAQDFSDGRVGMYGASYIGATQMLAASAAPEGLVAIAPQLTASEYHDGWSYSGGALQLGFLLLWVAESLAAVDLLRRPAGPGLDRARETLLEILRDPHAAYARLPLDRDDLAELAPYYREWLGHPARDVFWQVIDPGAAHGRMNVAGLHIGGWHDIFLEGTLRNYTGLRTRAPSPWARESQHLIVGPWAHGNLGDYQGDLWYGYGGASAALDLTAVHTEFFRAAAERRPADLPRARIFVMGANVWRDEDEWPLSRAREVSFFLRGEGGANSAGGDGRLGTEPPGPGEPADHYVSDPADPVPTAGGATFLPGVLLGRNSGPKDQAAVAVRDDVLVYTGEPLSEDLEVTGEVVVELYAASSADDCDWAVRLVDVHPDGTGYGVVDGILRARYRRGLDREVPLTPGEPELFRFALGTTSQLFRRGHRLRVQVASSNFPRFDRNPQRWIPVHTAGPDDMRPARQTVFHDASRPSRIIVPTIPS
ncbi:CocE/NonD family hydrolase [Streptosporangium sp. NPDC049248]|uniref:CocE/NonD family hydrolase n=1 Tax=Streptosporangium sp. NPDC049248 TaxID=3155651 RepID=UPI00341B38DE